MFHSFRRHELYELVWSEPMLALAKRFSISDRGLAKTCAAANIPVPTRGYWAKLQAGKAVARYPLPPRALGQSDDVSIGRSGWPYHESDSDILATPIPPVPVFEPDMDVVRSCAEALVRKAPLPLRNTHGWHSPIAKLMAADEERARKQRASPYPLDWDGPIFDKSFEQRRLRILNALFVCLTRCGMRPYLSGKYGRDIFVTVGTTAVPLSIDAVGAANGSNKNVTAMPFRHAVTRRKCGLSSRAGGRRTGARRAGRTSRVIVSNIISARSLPRSSSSASRRCARPPSVCANCA